MVYFGRRKGYKFLCFLAIKIKTMNKIVIALIVLIVGSIFGIKYFTQITQTEIVSVPPMKVARYYWPGEFWVDIADKKGWFAEEGLPVTLVDTNPDYFASLQDVVDGKIDTQEFQLFDLAKFVTQGADLVGIIAGDRSLGAEGIVVKKDIKSIRDLKGKKIGVPDETYLDFLLEEALLTKKLSDNDITEVHVLAETADVEFAKGDLDGVVTWEPILASAATKGNGHVIFTTADLPGVSVALWVFRKDFIKNRKEDVLKFTRVWKRTTDFIEANPDEAFGIIAQIYGTTKEDVQAFTEIDKILNLRENTIAFSYASGFDSFHGLAREVQDFLIKDGMAKRKINSVDYLDSTFVRQLRN